MAKDFLSQASPVLPREVQDLIAPIEAIPLGITISDTDGRILYLNDRAATALGYQRSELVGRDLQVLYGMSLTAEDIDTIRGSTLAGGWRGEVLNIRKDGSRFPVFLETSPIRNRDGEPVACLGVAWDITAQRAFQERLLTEARLGTLGLIAHNVAHVVRNHLSAIKMSLYMLEQCCTEPKGDEKLHFSIAQEEVNRIELYLRTLSNYASPPQPRFRERSLLEVVNQGIEDARPLLMAKSIALFRQFPKSSPQVTLDRDQFAQAITQVVQNACESLERGGEIHVVVKRQPVGERIHWLVEIRDNGPGIAPEILKRVYEPFYTTSSQRMGLGLSNVRRILDLHRGEVSTTSQPGRGTTVQLRIPERSP